MSPVRRGEDGYEFGPTWEAIAERKIREAMEAGLFDNLPGQGRPLDLEENPYAGDWEIGFHILRNNRLAPLWIELSREVQERADECRAYLERVARGADPRQVAARRRFREAYRQRVVELNQVIADFNVVVPFPWLQKGLLSVEEELRKFDERWPSP